MCCIVLGNQAPVVTPPTHAHALAFVRGLSFSRSQPDSRVFFPGPPVFPSFSGFSGFPLFLRVLQFQFPLFLRVFRFSSLLKIGSQLKYIWLLCDVLRYHTWTEQRLLEAPDTCFRPRVRVQLRPSQFSPRLQRRVISRHCLPSFLPDCVVYITKIIHLRQCR